MLYTVPLTVSLIGEDGNQVPHQMDALVILRFTQYFDFLKHSQVEKRAAIELRDAATPAFEGHLNSIEVSKSAVELLQKILESPMDHLKDVQKPLGQGKDFDVKEQFLNTDTTQSAILSLEDACAAILGGNETVGVPTEAE